MKYRGLKWATTRDKECQKFYKWTAILLKISEERERERESNRGLNEEIEGQPRFEKYLKLLEYGSLIDNWADLR